MSRSPSRKIKACSICKTTTRTDFSKIQYLFPDATRKCNDCIDRANGITPKPKSPTKKQSPKKEAKKASEIKESPKQKSTNAKKICSICSKEGKKNFSGKQWSLPPSKESSRRCKDCIASSLGSNKKSVGRNPPGAIPKAPPKTSSKAIEKRHKGAPKPISNANGASKVEPIQTKKIQAKPTTNDSHKTSASKPSKPSKSSKKNMTVQIPSEPTALSVNPAADMTDANIDSAFDSAVNAWKQFGKTRQKNVHPIDQSNLYGIYKYIFSGEAYARNKPNTDDPVELWKWNAWKTATATFKSDRSAKYAYSRLVFAVGAFINSPKNGNSSNVGNGSSNKPSVVPRSVSGGRKWNAPQMAAPKTTAPKTAAPKMAASKTAASKTVASKTVASKTTAPTSHNSSNNNNNNNNNQATSTATKKECNECKNSSKNNFSKAQWSGPITKSRRCKSCISNPKSKGNKNVKSNNNTTSTNNNNTNNTNNKSKNNVKSNGRKSNKKEFSLADSFSSVSLADAAAMQKASSVDSSKSKKNVSKEIDVTEGGTFNTKQIELRKLLAQCSKSANTSEMLKNATTFVNAIVNTSDKGVNGVTFLSSACLVDLLSSEHLLKSKNKLAREAGILCISEIIKKLGFQSIGSLFNVLALVLSLTGDKKGANVRVAAVQATFAMFDLLPKEAIPVFITQVLLEGKGAGLAPLARPETKVTSLQLLSRAASIAPKSIEKMMTILVPIISKAMWDVKKTVKEQAEDTLSDVASALDNIDIKPFIPQLVDSIADPELVPDIVYALAGTTFVQTVTASALSLTVPLLKRGFNDPKTAIKRKCAVITENMAKLVKNPVEVAPFMPILAPLLEKGIAVISDPECRKRFQAASEVLNKVGEKSQKEAVKQLQGLELVVHLKKSMLKNGAMKNTLSNPVVLFVADVAASIGNVQLNFKSSHWINALNGLIASCFDKKNQKESIAAASNAIEDMRLYAVSVVGVAAAGGETKSQSIDENDMKDGREDICDLQFSLAYGSKILLNNSRLHLRKGCKYGVISEKSAGKTTMMRAISNGQVEGFPTPAMCRSIFIENDIQGSQLNMNVREFLVDSIGFGIVLDLAAAEQALKVGGFTQVMCDGKITQLSGGWKMKLALIRATLEKADIMLMDEPTNHLDVINVQWAVDYINSLPEVTCIIVSHDTGFLDKVVTHMIRFEDLKLNCYKGNISVLVKRFPECKSYFELSETNVVFKFPQPMILDGVKTKGTPILQINNCDFTYPGAKKPQLIGVTVKCSMASRVACVGANGAGKSTMIKILTGEMKPSSGTVKKHPNCRFAYVAQHAFHHIEQHLEKSPNEYIRWRYEGGVDKESRAKTTAIVTDEEQDIMDKPFEVKWVDEESGKTLKEKRIIKKLVSRRKVKKEYHYEVQWKNKTMDFNSWYPRETLRKRGFTKLITALDDKLAASQQDGKPLTSRNVEEHLGNVGLAAEEATHARIKDLSGGQKVKVVLAACTWCCPHLIILDEPTNYLDRDSLGALANAIKEFDGGVILITHNKEFADATTKVTWVIANNRCDIKGDPEWEKYAAEQEVIQAEENAEFFDEAGNKIDGKKAKLVEDLTRQEVKRFKRDIKNKIKENVELEEFEMDYCDEWNIKYLVADD